MGKFEDPIVKCPFYSWEEGRRLCCEGVISVSMTHTFATKEQRRMYERTRCKRAWRDCPFVPALEKKWEI
jgi:hypothetical protein